MRIEVFMSQAQTATEGLDHALRDGLSGLDRVPRAIRKILQHGYWKKRLLRNGQIVTNTRFIDYITKPPHEGLGADLVQIKKLLWQHPRILAMFERALAGEHGGDRKSEAAQIKIDNIKLDKREKFVSQGGTSQAYLVRRLQKSRPDLLLKVEAGTLTAYKAAREAGFVKTMNAYQQVLKLVPKLTEQEWQAVKKKRAACQKVSG